jgi:hypothetical protein
MLKKVDARKIYFALTLLKTSTRDPHHQLIKLLMTENIFETGFPGIFQDCRSIPGQEEFNK